MATYPAFHYLRNSEYTNYAACILHELRQLSAHFAASDIEILDTLLQEHQAAMVGKPRNQFTPVLRDVDQMRESAFMALRDYIKACNRRLKPEWQAPSLRLIEVFRIYGWNLYTTDYKRQSSKITMLIHELVNDPANQKALRELDAIEWLKELHEVNKEFEVVLQERDRTKPPAPPVKTKDTRLQLRDTTRAWIQVLEAKQASSPSPELAQALQRIEETVLLINKNVEARVEKSKHKQSTRWGSTD